MPSSQEALYSVKTQQLVRIQTNILAHPEREFLDWLCVRIPRAITPDQLTGIGIIGAAIVFTGYLASHIDPAYLWLATFGLVVHWFGDSLDGSLARHRRIERPRYGYFLDHSADAVSILLILLGLGLTSYVRLDIALFALLGYFMLGTYVFLCSQVTGYLQLSFLALGPTEMRIQLSGLDSLMYFAGDTKILIGHESFSPYDLVVFTNGIAFVGLFIVNMLKVMRQLGREDVLPPSL